MKATQEYYFPFGEKLKKVQQADKVPKKAFVLGVYASAVHARWIDKTGMQKVAALAVASEPSIFWVGDNAEEIISGIKIPAELGSLTVPTNKGMNGPSGKALDELYLKPLGLSRDDTWLCDLLPESRVNERQKNVIEKFYNQSLNDGYDLKPASIPDFKKSELNSPERRLEILQELETSQANTIILLGDLPIYWFLRFYSYHKFSKLSDFIKADSDYGQPQELKINGKSYHVIPFCHPRQAAGLGTFNVRWSKLHKEWLKKISDSRLKE